MKLLKAFSFVILFLAAFNQADAQLYFNQANNIPVTINSTLLSNAWAGGINFPLWSSIDLNGDGLMDLYMYDRTNDRVMTFVNDGSAGSGAFHFDPQYVNRFPKVVQGGWAKCFDYNCDGKMDFYTIDALGTGIAVYRNDYSIATGLQFTLVSPQLMESTSTTPVPVYATRVLIPTFIDVDNDGDVDILGFNSTPNGQIAYHKNYAVEKSLPCDSLSFKFETTCWGNFALAFNSNKVSTFHNPPCPPPIAMDQDSSFAYRGIHSNSDSLISNGFGGYEEAKRDDTITTIFALDSDGDGLKDLLIGDLARSNCLLVHNGGTLQVADADSQDTLFPSNDVPIKITEFISHSYIDVDNDGKNDLIASAGQNEDKNGVWFYKNNGTNASPVFNLQSHNFMQGSMIDEGEAAAPVLFDYNADGLMDLIIAYGVYDTLFSTGIGNKLALYKNIGTATSPAFEFVTDDYAGISAYNTSTSFTSPIYATFGDMNNDGDQDMIIGDATGKLYYFNNSAGAGNPANFQLTIPQYFSIDVGNDATPQIVDLNNDGLLDLVVGEKNGNINYFQNKGTLNAPSFTSNPALSPNTDSLGKIVVRPPGFVNGFSVPYVYKYNNTHHMLVSNMEGKVFTFENIDGNLYGAFTRTDSLFNGSLGVRTTEINLTVSGGDLNNDSLPDMLVGLFSGGMQVFYGSKTNAIAEVNKENPFECFPNPANETLTIKFAKNDNSKHILRMYNAVGERMIEKNFSGSSFSFDTRNLAAGFYYLELTDHAANQSSCKKVIIYH